MSLYFSTTPFLEQPPLGPNFLKNNLIRASSEGFRRYYRGYFVNKQDYLKLNIVPEGKAAWLSYEEYLELAWLFEAVDIPSEDPIAPDVGTPSAYADLYNFLVRVAGLTNLPRSQQSIHFNAFTLLRRGYTPNSAPKWVDGALGNKSLSENC